MKNKISEGKLYANSFTETLPFLIVCSFPILIVATYSKGGEPHLIPIGTVVVLGK